MYIPLSTSSSSHDDCLESYSWPAGRVDPMDRMIRFCCSMRLFKKKKIWGCGCGWRECKHPPTDAHLIFIHQRCSFPIWDLLNGGKIDHCSRQWGSAGRLEEMALLTGKTMMRVSVDSDACSDGFPIQSFMIFWECSANTNCHHSLCNARHRHWCAASSPSTKIFIHSFDGFRSSLIEEQVEWNR